MEVHPEWESALRDGEQHIAESVEEDVTREEQLLNEAQKRFEWLMNPTGSQWATWATTGGFLWYLGVSPAAGLVNLSQTAIVAFPVLASRYGVGAALKTLNRSVVEVIKARRLKGDRGDYNQWGTLSEDERKAFRQWHADGVIDTTQTQMLMGVVSHANP
ncbi:MAG: PLxRFG domain-containing protein [bacterium]|nr:PLxRFG domain-containing protein [bacterium]